LGVCNAILRVQNLLLLPLVVVVVVVVLWVAGRHVLGGLHMHGQLIRMLVL
jgi:hypothetical protein